MGSSLVLAFIAGLLAISSGVDALTQADCDKLSDTLKQKCYQIVARTQGAAGGSTDQSGGVTGSFSHDGGTTLGGSGGSYTLGGTGGSSGGGTMGGGDGGAGGGGGGLLSGGLGGGSGGSKGADSGHLTLGGGSSGSTGDFGLGGSSSADKNRRKCWDAATMSWKTDCSRGVGDPILSGFTGRSFNFNGTVGKIYNLVSSKHHQLSTKLKPAPMWNHVGTNMEGIAMMFKSYRVLMELDGDTPKVYINEKQLAETKKHIQRHAWHFEDGTSVEVEWDMYKPTIGNTVTVTTALMKVMMWHTPAGIIDEGGATLVGYLNFNITLMSAPENNVMSGVIGDTYERFNVGMEAYNPNSTYYLPEDDLWHGKGQMEDYEMKSYWDTDFKMNTFGKDIVEIQDRSSLEIDVVPLVDLPASASSMHFQPKQLSSRGGGLLRQRRLLL